MFEKEMTPSQRVHAAVSFQEPDRVPFFLLLTMHGAKELGLSIRDYFSKAEYVAEGQLRLQAKYRHDCLYTFFYAAVEVEAWGSDVLYVENGPPNAGAPLIRQKEDILSLSPPNVDKAPSLIKVLRTQEMLKAKVGSQVPIIGVVISPFSLPVMQLGFDRYIELLYENPDLFERLMTINEKFCVEWANAQLRAGATTICYFDPVSSSTIIPPDMYLRTGFPVAQRTLAKIKGPTATHMASGICRPIMDQLALTGTKIVGVSGAENLGALKKSSSGKVALMGNLNGIEMRRWDAKHTEEVVRNAIAQGGPGGGYILSDAHGEIPFQVPDEVLVTISETVHKHGQYPLEAGDRSGSDGTEQR
ncbi:MAG: uroporphyrinogen decarboxylase family protein [Deltaproteobacteria bacterium]|nr:uroporphyrinogen decarboxylase family protein [Deltaproteobacteria bacterium]